VEHDYSRVLSGTQPGLGEEVFTYFSWMRQAGSKPNPALTSLLSVSGTMAVLEQGRTWKDLKSYRSV